MATETLRPNAAGDETNIGSQSPASSAHWDKVDEAIADEGTTAVWQGSGAPTTWYRDLYNLPASSGSGTINKITLYFRVLGATPVADRVKGVIKSDTTVTETAEKDPGGDFGNGVWGTYSEEWATNPADAQAWEWSDIDSLQIGVSLKNALACFLAGTKIRLGDGSFKNIEGIKAGDIVKSYNEQTQRIENSKVIRIFNHPPNPQSSYLIINNRIRITGEHLVWLNDGWEKAWGAKTGDQLQCIDGSKEEIRTIEHISGVPNVFNIQVDKNQNYFAEGILAHNKTPSCTQVYVVVDYTTGWAGGDVCGVAIAAIAKINGIALADITKVNGVS